ncbi:MAG: elongation factor 4 [Acidobacteria bacterium]|nr:elongation factor 4 [Acidobacteriota bacterium]MCG3192243.1 Elongation factor 4 [Thermoanaerobaculia bacterium]MCK6681962.1 translation elongation factor 4 [Thermoanaerobaculia bacterium]
MTDPTYIRNFSIVAHIDHGKTTLSDRILEITGALSAREMTEQVLDDNPIERERGITIKARSVTLNYRSEDGHTYLFNLIDTPGHVDFTYEVSRSLAACEGAVLVVDATQGVEAQTLANAYLAIHNDLTIVPCINKIDLPSAVPAMAREQIEEVIGIPAQHAPLTSGKVGTGVKDLLEHIVHDIPPPAGDPGAPLRALLFDSWFDVYRGVTCLVRVKDGSIRPGTKIRLMGTGVAAEVQEVGIYTPKQQVVSELSVGEVGYLIAGIKDLHATKVGDTVTEAERPCQEPLPGFQDVKPMVFASIFPTESDEYENLRDAMEKLRLNDASFTFEPESSTALGFGFRCGYLGLLHMEIVQERLEREFNLSLVTTAPSVPYRVKTTRGELLEISNPVKLPEPQYIDEIEEPYILATIITKDEFLGGLLALAEERRGKQVSLEYAGTQRAVLKYEFPLNEVVLDFYDKLKSISRGYASFDYQLIGYRPGDLVKLDILINGDAVDALAFIVHRAKSATKGRALVEKMKEMIPQQMFEVIIQAAIGSKILARSTVRALRKNVLAKCYGGDITRKKKLLEKQKEGKKRMKKVGRVDLPQEAFLAVLRVDD